MSIDVIVPAPPAAPAHAPLALIDTRPRGRTLGHRSVGERVDAAIATALTSQAIWVVPVVALQVVLILRIDSRAPLSAAQSLSGLAAIAATVFTYLSSRRLFGQGAALVGAAVFAVAAPTLLAAWSTSAAAAGVGVAAVGLCVLTGSRGDRLVALIGLALICLGAAIATHAGWHPRYPADRVVLLRREALAVGPILVAAAVGVVASRRRRAAAALLVAAVLPVVGQVGLGQPAGLHRNLAVSLLFLAPLAGITGMTLLRRGRALGVRATAALLLCGALLSSSLTTSDGVVRYLSHPAVSDSSAVPAG